MITATEVFCCEITSYRYVMHRTWCNRLKSLSAMLNLILKSQTTTKVSNSTNNVFCLFKKDPNVDILVLNSTKHDFIHSNILAYFNLIGIKNLKFYTIAQTLKGTKCRDRLFSISALYSRGPRFEFGLAWPRGFQVPLRLSSNCYGSTLKYTTIAVLHIV
jgi:hypothetical protein